MKRTTLVLVVASLLASGVQADRQRTYYTDARVQTMRTNLANYEWARTQRDAALVLAEKWAALGDDRLRALVIPPCVFRGYDVHPSGCPIHGAEIYKKGGYAWLIDVDRPFKVKCPIGGEEYPSNDFAAYLASGMKDRSLLTGEYADDGHGWHKPGDPGKANYWFVGYYAHWSMQRFVSEAMANLANGVLFTEDPAKAKLYAHKLAVLLYQMAIYYPDYDYKTQSREDIEENPDYRGKITNFIWECGWPEFFAKAYDALKPFLDEDSDLQKSVGKSAAEIDAFIRERTLVHAAKEIMAGTGRIRGNYGTHQRTLLIVAQALDEKTAKPTSEEMIKWVNENGFPVSIRDLGLRDALVNLTYRDGNPPESFSYNEDWMDNLTEVAETLAEAGGVNYYENPRFQRALLWPYDLLIAGTYCPSFGDVGCMFGASGHWSPEQNQRALRCLKNPDPKFAWGMKGTKPERFDIWSPAVEPILAEFAKKPQPRVGLDSILFPGYGIANLQSGSDANKTGSSLAYGANPNHSHYDQLNMVFFAEGNPLLTDLGYPDQMDGFNPRLSGYHNNTISHNTVTVDAKKQGRKPGTIHAFSKNKFAQVADMSCEGAYEGVVSQFRRAHVMVQVTPQHSYLFDVFYVRGGKQHDFALHGTQADLICEPPLGPVQTQGTLAGVDVPYAEMYDDPTMKGKPIGSVNYTPYTGSGFQFLTNVQRAPLNGYAYCDWKLTEPNGGKSSSRPWQGIALRAHLLGTNQELISCDGPVQQYDYLPKTIKCLIRRRTGENLSSCFTTILEPYKIQPWIKRVSPVKITPDDGQAAAALIVMANGARHYVFHSTNPDKTYTLDGKLRVTGQAACLVMDVHSKPVKCMLLNGRSLTFGKYAVKGKGLRRTKIASVDYVKGIIELADPGLTKDLGPDNVVLVRHEGFADCVTPRKMLDSKRFSIGDEDLRVAGGPVTEVKPDEITTSARNLFALPGHTITNGSYEPVGRLAAKRPAGWMVEGYKPLTWDSFKTAPGDAGPRYYVVMAGVGDDVWIPDCVLRGTR